MIDLIIKGKDKEDVFLMKEKMHKALVGSPAYRESEIAICDEDDNTFHLIIGNNNECNIKKTINTNDLKD